MGVRGRQDRLLRGDGADFATFVVGAGTYALLAVTTSVDIAPNWAIGLLCGAGGLAGGYLGARLQPRLPDTGLRLPLGVLAITVAILYAVQTPWADSRMDPA